MKPLLLCTDLDRTLIPNGEQPESPRARPLFRQLVRQDSVRLAYVSGRDRHLIREAIAQWELPEPDFAIADVGTTIYTVQQGEWRHLQEWENHIRQDWQGRQSADLLPLVTSLPAAKALQVQEQERQKPCKLSFYASAGFDWRDALPRLQEGLTAQGLRVNLIWSVDETTSTGLLDVLPESADKLQALQFLARYLRMPEDALVFAGDSGNDLAVLRSGLPGILVANATPDVRAQIDPGTPHLCLAEGGYLGMNGYYAAGILEGLAHLRPDVDAWLRQQP